MADLLVIEGGLPNAGVHTVRKVSSDGTITRVAGTGARRSGSDASGDGGPAENARVEGTAVVPTTPTGRRSTCLAAAT